MSFSDLPHIEDCNWLYLIGNVTIYEYDKGFFFFFYKKKSLLCFYSNARSFSIFIRRETLSAPWANRFSYKYWAARTCVLGPFLKRTQLVGRPGGPANSTWPAKLEWRLPTFSKIAMIIVLLLFHMVFFFGQPLSLSFTFPIFLLYRIGTLFNLFILLNLSCRC